MACIQFNFREGGYTVKYVIYSSLNQLYFNYLGWIDFVRTVLVDVWTFKTLPYATVYNTMVKTDEFWVDPLNIEDVFL